MTESYRRTDELRLDAPELESAELRQARLNALQLESLGSDRRNRISTSEFREDRKHQVHWKALESHRLSNISGTKENRESFKNRDQLSSWNNLEKILEGDGAVEENLGDINRGQTHRAKLIKDLSPQASHEGLTAGHYARQNVNHGAPSRGNHRGGRGGGFVGTQSRASTSSSRRRIPTGIPSVSTHGSDAGRQTFRSDTQNANQQSAVVPKSHDPAIRSKPDRQSTPRAAPAQNVARPALTTNWESKLAAPETFVAAIRRDWGLREEATSLIEPSVPTTQTIVSSEAPVIGETTNAIESLVKPTNLSPSEIGETNLLIDFATPPQTKSSESTSSYSGDLAGIRMLSGSSRLPGSFASSSNDIRGTNPPQAKIDEIPDVFQPSLSGTPIAGKAEHTRAAKEKFLSQVINTFQSSAPSSSRSLVQQGKQPSTASFVTPNLIDIQPAPNVGSRPLKLRVKLPDPIITRYEHREQIVSKISMDENIHFGRHKRRHPNSIIGGHLMPGRMRESIHIPGGNLIPGRTEESSHTPGEHFIPERIEESSHASSENSMPERVGESSHASGETSMPERVEESNHAADGHFMPGPIEESIHAAGGHLMPGPIEESGHTSNSWYPPSSISSGGPFGYRSPPSPESEPESSEDNDTSSTQLNEATAGSPSATENPFGNLVTSDTNFSKDGGIMHPSVNDSAFSSTQTNEATAGSPPSTTQYRLADLVASDTLFLGGGGVMDSSINESAFSSTSSSTKTDDATTGSPPSATQYRLADLVASDTHFLEGGGVMDSSINESAFSSTSSSTKTDDATTGSPPSATACRLADLVASEEGGGIMDFPINESAFSRSAASTSAAPLNRNTERPDKATNMLGTENRRPSEQIEEQDDDEENPFARITTNVQLPTGPSRFSSLMGLSNPQNHHSQGGIHPPPRRANNHWNRGSNRNA